MNWKNTMQKGFPEPIKFGVTFLVFLMGNVNMREVEEPPKVEILYEVGKALQGGFLESAKIAYTLQGLLLVCSNSEKSGGHQKKKFFINNTVEVLILLKEDYQFLLIEQWPSG